MKKTSLFKKLIAITLSLTLIMSCILIGTPHAHAFELVFREENDKRVGIEYITIGDTTYYDINGGRSNVDDVNQVELLKQALSVKYNELSLLEAWSNIASLLYEHIGGKTYGYSTQGDFSQNFDTHFANTQNGQKFSIDVIDYLNKVNNSNDTLVYYNGNVGDDRAQATGLTYVNSLNGAQDLMASQILDVLNTSQTDVRNIKWHSTGSYDGFELMKDTANQTVLTSIVTAHDNSGVGHRQFSSFGIAFYDFKLTPVTDEKLDYITAAEGFDLLEDAIKEGTEGVSYSDTSGDEPYVSYVENTSDSESLYFATFSESNSVSVSNSMKSTKTYSFTESINSTTNFEATFPLIGKANQSISLGFSASQAISTAYGETKTQTSETTTSSTAGMLLPAHTKLGVSQSSGKTVVNLDYDCPVIITYKVAIFAMNGELRINDGAHWQNAEGGMCLVFGGESVISDSSAAEDIYYRAKNGYELGEGAGKVFGNHNGNSGGLQSIEWNNVLGKTQTHGSASIDDCIDRLKNYVPLSAAGGTMNMVSTSLSTDITDISPLYDLDNVKVDGNALFTVAPSGNVDLNKVGTLGFNKYNIPYYGYASDSGSWVLSDADGNELSSVEGANISSNGVITLDTVGTYYAKFKIDENLYKKVNNENEYITNDDLSSTAIIQINVTNTGADHHCVAGDWQTTIPATCTAQGEQISRCGVCQVIMHVQTVPAIEHTPVKTVTPSTCQSEGVENEFCSVCNTLLSSKTLPKLDHTPGPWETSVEATCEVDGEKHQKCTGCDALLAVEAIEAHGHAAVWLTVKEATCQAAGREENTCTICNAVLETRAIEKTEHVPGRYEIIKDATCTATGLMQQACAYCDALLGDLIVIEAHEHKTGSWVTVIEPTCTTDGEKVKSCTVCGGALETEVIPALGHDDGVWVTSLEATCETAGEEHKNCTRCGTLIDRRRIDALGHTPGPAMTCVTDQVCLVCEEVIIPADGKSHVWTDWATYKEASFFVEEQQIRVCTSCDLEEYRFVKGTSKCHKYFPHCDGSGEDCWACETLSNTNGFFRNLGKFITWFFYENIITNILFPFIHGHYHENVNVDEMFGS